MAKDVCEVLGLGNVTEALRGLDEDEKGVHIIDTPGGKQEMTIISESGLYALVFRSHKPEAHAFSKWVRGDVLPTYRQKASSAHRPKAVWGRVGLERAHRWGRCRAPALA